MSENVLSVELIFPRKKQGYQLKFAQTLQHSAYWGYKQNPIIIMVTKLQQEYYCNRG